MTYPEEIRIAKKQADQNLTYRSSKELQMEIPTIKDSLEIAMMDFN